MVVEVTRPRRKGYGRVSSKGQALNGNSLEDQRRKLEESGCAEEDIVLETYTGTKVDRPKFTALVEGLEPGDTLVVTKLDRFARTASEGSELVKGLLARGVNVHILNMGLIENTPTGRLILNVLLSFAEFERDMIVERTSEGKAVAKATNPDFKEGRPRKEIPGKFYELLDGGVSVAEACKVLGIHRTQWYRWKKESCRA